MPQDATLCRAGFAGETQSRVGFLARRAARIDTIGPFGLAPARERRKNIALSRVAEGPARRSHSNRSFGTLVLIPTQIREGLRKIRFARW